MIKPLLGLSDRLFALGLYTTDDEWVDMGAETVGTLLFGALVLSGVEWTLLDRVLTRTGAKVVRWVVTVLA